MSLTNIYLIGDATPNGWNMGSLTPMQKNGSVYTWTGQLNPENLSLLNSIPIGVMEQIIAETTNQTIANTAFKLRDNCQGDDNKWKVSKLLIPIL